MGDAGELERVPGRLARRGAPGELLRAGRARERRHPAAGVPAVGGDGGLGSTRGMDALSADLVRPGRAGAARLGARPEHVSDRCRASGRRGLGDPGEVALGVVGVLIPVRGRRFGFGGLGRSGRAAGGGLRPGGLQLSEVAVAEALHLSGAAVRKTFGLESSWYCSGWPSSVYDREVT